MPSRKIFTKRSAVVLAAGGAAALSAAFFVFRSPANESTQDAAPSTPVTTLQPATGTQIITEPSTVPTAPLTQSYSPETRQRLGTLQQILASHNDNDMRLDTDFRNLNPETKQALQAYYRTLPREDRNGRGTVIFLLGRELKSREDAEFLAEALREKPCQSLSDCSKDPGPTSGSEQHHESTVNVTLAYPELTALKALEKVLTPGSTATPEVKAAARDALKAAAQSQIPMVAKKAEELLRLDRPN